MTKKEGVSWLEKPHYFWKDKNGKTWAFYENGEITPIEESEKVVPVSVLQEHNKIIENNFKELQNQLYFKEEVIAKKDIIISDLKERINEIEQDKPKLMAEFLKKNVDCMRLWEVCEYSEPSDFGRKVKIEAKSWKEAVTKSPFQEWGTTAIDITDYAEMAKRFLEQKRGETK